MERVTGIGGYFFRARDPQALNDWYERHLGVRHAGQQYEDGSWWQDEGPTVFSAEDDDDQQFGGPDHGWRINFRVRDLEAMIHQLRASGIKVDIDDTPYPNGRFAYVNDPEGNSIELWQPAGTDAVRPVEQDHS